ncbi:MAG TPA: potassium channel family protein, partial [Gemmataceae bacterium]|nr:potassium channel family protein [Gemmataceae bacterium]
MAWVGALAALGLIAVVLIDAFEAMILPRRVSNPYRLARFFYRAGWLVWRAVACRILVGRRRHTFLGVFGPLSLLGLIVVWAAGLVVGFGLLHWSLGTPVSLPDTGFGTYVYFSGTTFFTLGYGDIVPTGPLGRALAVFETGLGLGFVAVVISYLPVLYQAFSRREIAISLLDARAGSPPTAGELLRRLTAGRSPAGVAPLLAEWERWSAELLESQLSYPVLSYYRSQHDNQSWVGALTVILDTSALLIAGVEGPDGYQARLTFAMGRHAAVDLAMISGTPPLPPPSDRLPPAGLARLRDSLRGAGVAVRDGPEVAKALADLRGLYEPFVSALAAKFLFVLPPFQPDAPPVDNWQTSAWMR